MMMFLISALLGHRQLGYTSQYQVKKWGGENIIYWSIFSLPPTNVRPPIPDA